MEKSEELILAEIMVKLTSLERLLIAKNIVSAQEIYDETKTLSEQILKSVAQSIKDNNEPKAE